MLHLLKYLALIISFNSVLGFNGLDICFGDNCVKECTVPACFAQCYGSYCKTNCSVSECRVQCTYPGCSTACFGKRCKAQCYGTGCKSLCIGDDCRTTCYAPDKKCDVKCSGNKCVKLTEKSTPAKAPGYMDDVDSLVFRFKLDFPSHNPSLT